METKGRKERKRKKRKKKRNGTKKKSGSAHVRRTTEDLRLLAGRRQPFRESAERGPTDIHHRVLYSSLLRLLLKGEGEGLKEMLKEEEMREPRWWMLVRATITHKVWRRRRLTAWRDDQRTEKRRATHRKIPFSSAAHSTARRQLPLNPQLPALPCPTQSCSSSNLTTTTTACVTMIISASHVMKHSHRHSCVYCINPPTANPLLCPLKNTHTQIHREERVGID